MRMEVGASTSLLLSHYRSVLMRHSFMGCTFYSCTMCTYEDAILKCYRVMFVQDAIGLCTYTYRMLLECYTGN